jgi:CheY-like chemotaxis protein
MGQTVANDVATILVVEDDALISDMIGDAFHRHGFQVYAVSNAAAALRYLLSGSPADVLFTDINLAGDIDGTILAERAREVHPDLPIVFASGRAGLFEHLRTIPGAACLAKPYSPAQACRIVEQLVAPPIEQLEHESVA